MNIEYKLIITHDHTMRISRIDSVDYGCLYDNDEEKDNSPTSGAGDRLLTAASDSENTATQQLNSLGLTTFIKNQLAKQIEHELKLPAGLEQLFNLSQNQTITSYQYDFKQSKGFFSVFLPGFGSVSNILFALILSFFAVVSMFLSLENKESEAPQLSLPIISGIFNLFIMLIQYQFSGASNMLAQYGMKLDRTIADYRKGNTHILQHLGTTTPLVSRRNSPFGFFGNRIHCSKAMVYRLLEIVTVLTAEVIAANRDYQQLTALAEKASNKNFPISLSVLSTLVWGYLIFGFCSSASFTFSFIDVMHVKLLNRNEQRRELSTDRQMNFSK